MKKYACPCGQQFDSDGDYLAHLPQHTPQEIETAFRERGIRIAEIPGYFARVRALEAYLNEKEGLVLFPGGL
jgi:hypothetical protein